MPLLKVNNHHPFLKCTAFGIGICVNLNYTEDERRMGHSLKDLE
jgi:hypothetical protein